MKNNHVIKGKNFYPIKKNEELVHNKMKNTNKFQEYHKTH